MLIRRGWSGETRSGVWQKFDIELDETDLTRVLSALGGPAKEELSTTTAFQILEAEAEKLVVAELAGRFDYPAPEASERISAANLAQLKALSRHEDSKVSE